MATYRLEAKVIGRSAGKCATAAAAYRSADIIYDERTGLVFDYTRKGGVVHSEILAPDNAPAWMLDRSALWNAVERVEKRKDAQLARDLTLSLPHELDDVQRLELIREFIQTEFVAKGMIADLNIHRPDRQSDDRNHHAHVMLTMRDLTGDGFGTKNRDWNQTEQLEEWRAAWADHVNTSLERYGIDARVDHRSLEDQGIDREPEPKQGPVATQMEQEGRPSHAGDDRRQVKRRNAELAELKAEMAALQTEIFELEEQMAEIEKLDPTQDTMAPLRAEREEIRRLAEAEDRARQYREQQEREAEDQRRKAEKEQRAREDQAWAGDIHNSHTRHAIALGECYRANDPWGSLAETAAREYAMFAKQQEEYRFKEANAKTEEERRFHETTRHVEHSEYNRDVYQRCQRMSETTSGRSDHESVVEYRNLHEKFAADAVRQREERAEAARIYREQQEQQNQAEEQRRQEGERQQREETVRRFREDLDRQQQQMRQEDARKAEAQQQQRAADQERLARFAERFTPQTRPEQTPAQTRAQDEAQQREEHKGRDVEAQRQNDERASAEKARGQEESSRSAGPSAQRDTSPKEKGEAAERREALRQSLIQERDGGRGGGENSRSGGNDGGRGR